MSSETVDTETARTVVESNLEQIRQTPYVTLSGADLATVLEFLLDDPALDSAPDNAEILDAMSQLAVDGAMCSADSDNE